ncbi:uncharacterized mitochondrial protein AtMg00810-like [Solanum stenotomum]|uniref:uncharacterized mitochondrial protein AtMg00810-like n=1 Tax=Solanum stenotomum TaxID=172797 RepID=UPI0020CFEDA4|nr:uncharacterized mitochondrial protein AtMg00810-like [Solanum stenotomum]
MKDLGEVKFFLGIEFARSKKGIIMSQRKYALELISELGLSGTKPFSTPLETNLKLISTDYDAFIINEKGGIPKAEDTSLADPTQYQSSGKLEAYCDSDWGGYLQTRRSVTGYLETIARSSAKAEFRSMASVVAEPVQSHSKAMLNNTQSVIFRSALLFVA